MAPFPLYNVVEHAPFGLNGMFLVCFFRETWNALSLTWEVPVIKNNN